MSVKTNIVIITYNALEYTKATIKSLFETTSHNFIMTIIDNNSNYATIDYLKKLKVPANCIEYNLILNKKNMGVGYAYNQGQNLSFEKDIKYTAFCNNDLYFSKGWLLKLEDRLDKNPKIAMLSPLRPSAKVLYDINHSTRDKLFMIGETSSWRKELEAYMDMKIKDFDIFCKKIILANKNGELECINFPDSLSTCVCITNNKIFKDLNRFADPQFVSYGGEDIDTTWTMLDMGFKCCVDHSVYIHHFRGKSLKDNKLSRENLLKNSNKILYEKWEKRIISYINNNKNKKNAIEQSIIKNLRPEHWLLHELNKTINFIKI